MADLFLHGSEVATVFDLLGRRENDITFSLGWGLARSGTFLDVLLGDWFPEEEPGEIIAVRLQEHAEDGGYTDIEVWTENLVAIVEAKRGWTVPSDAQLERYAARLRYMRRNRAIVVLTECSDEYARPRLPKRARNIRVLHRRWSQVREQAEQAAQAGSRREKQQLRELSEYLGGVISMQDQDSNWVYVVALGNEPIESSGLTWISVVADHRLYFHHYGKHGWPKDPPNYIGVRYHGRLQSIHHVDHYEITDDLSKRLRKLTRKHCAPGRFKGEHVLYHLGPPIIPSKTVKTGKLYRAARVWAALDLLLTCDTIAEARDKTRERFA